MFNKLRTAGLREVRSIHIHNNICSLSHISPSSLYPSTHHHAYGHPSHQLQKRQHMIPRTTPSQRRITPKNLELAQRCEEVTKIGVYANIGLVIIKGGAGCFTHSMALIADAMHSATDLVSDVSTFLTIKYSQRKATSTYPMGFGKLDTLGMFPVSALLMFGSFHIVKSSMSKLSMVATSASVMTMHMPYLAMAVVIISLCVKEWLYRITVKAGKEYNSNVTIANAWHHRTDAYSSFIALLGIVGYNVGWTSLDPFCGIVVGAYLFKIGVDFFKMGLEQLLDKNSPTHYALVTKLLSECDGINGTNELIVTQSGQYIHVNVEVKVQEHLQMTEVQQLLDDVKTKLYSCDALNIQHLAVIPVVSHVYDQEECGYEHTHENPNKTADKNVE